MRFETEFGSALDLMDDRTIAAKKCRIPPKKCLGTNLLKAYQKPTAIRKSIDWLLFVLVLYIFYNVLNPKISNAQIFSYKTDYEFYFSLEFKILKNNYFFTFFVPIVELDTIII